METIERRTAWEAGSKFFYTGRPCKQGHLAQRYVSTGSCVECQSPYKVRKHPHDKDLIPYMCPKLWVPVGTTPEHYQALADYLQLCIDTFFKHKAAAP